MLTFGGTQELQVGGRAGRQQPMTGFVWLQNSVLLFSGVFVRHI